jgi:hypothetical protein
MELRTLRIPIGLWNDLQETVIQQDRQFLIDVAKSLGLPIPEVLRKCLGSGCLQQLPILMGDDPALQCPWWDRRGFGLWTPCRHPRMHPTMPCHHHERAKPDARLVTDPIITDLPQFRPIKWKDVIYWMDPEGKGATYREDGSIVEDGEFHYVEFKGVKTLTWNKSGG